MHLSILFSVSKYDFWSYPRYIRSLILNPVEAILSINKPICLNHVMWSRHALRMFSRSSVKVAQSVDENEDRESCIGQRNGEGKI